MKLSPELPFVPFGTDMWTSCSVQPSPENGLEATHSECLDLSRL